MAPTIPTSSGGAPGSRAAEADAVMRGELVEDARALTWTEWRGSSKFASEAAALWFE